MRGIYVISRLTAFTVSIVFFPAFPVSSFVSPAIWKERIGEFQPIRNMCSLSRGKLFKRRQHNNAHGPFYSLKKYHRRFIKTIIRKCCEYKYPAFMIWNMAYSSNKSISKFNYLEFWSSEMISLNPHLPFVLNHEPFLLHTPFLVPAKVRYGKISWLYKLKWFFSFCLKSHKASSWQLFLTVYYSLFPFVYDVIRHARFLFIYFMTITVTW